MCIKTQHGDYFRLRNYEYFFFYMFSVFKVFHSDFASLHLKYMYILRLSSGSLDSRLTLWPGSWRCIDIAGPLVSTQNEIGTNGGL